MPDWTFPNAATPTGSAAYYTVRFSDPAARDELAAAFAWREELNRIVARAHDPGVARLKLDWWRDELRRTQAGVPHHPLSEALSGILTKPGTLDLVYTMLEAVEDDIRKLQPDEISDFHHHCDQLGGGFGELLATIVNQTGCDTLAAACNLGSYAEAVDRIANLARHLHRDFCPLPLKSLRAKQLNLTDLRAGRAGELPAVLHDIAQYRARIVEQIIGGGESIAPVTPAHRLAAQAVVLLKKMARLNYPVLTQHTELVPLRRLWAGWRLR